MRALKYLGIGGVLGVVTIFLWLVIGRVLLGSELNITPEDLQVKVWGEVFVILAYALATLIIGYVGDWFNKKMITK